MYMKYKLFYNSDTVKLVLQWKKLQVKIILEQITTEIVEKYITL